jgi:hypothetical protein
MEIDGENNFKHLYTSNQKLRWWGYGEWVEEPDIGSFMHEEFSCIIKRIFIIEPSGNVFGGHWCGKIKIPKDHLWAETVRDFAVKQKQGLDYSESHPCPEESLEFFKENIKNDLWIRFEYDREIDLIPSIYYVQKQIIGMVSLFDFFDTTYKNMNYVISKCKEVAEDAKKTKI